MNFLRTLLVSAVLAFAPLYAGAETAPAQTYQTLLDQLKGGNTGIDFQALRYAYSETPQYSPYGSPPTKKQEFSRAFDAQNWDEALAAANALLDANYTDMEGHLMCAAAYEKEGDLQQAEFHRAVSRGLVKSIADSGDGKSVDTALVVIAVPEEYQFLALNGFAVRQQALVTGKNGPVDAMTVVDRKTNEGRTFFFNVARVFAGYGRALGGLRPSAPAP